MASSMVRAVCWKCEKSFPSVRDRKNHMANREHSCLRVICPFCSKEKFLRRSSPELVEHCTKIHTKLIEALPKGFFAEGNGFWLSRYPRDYLQLVEPSQKTSLQAVKARELIREKFQGMKELEEWEAGWRLVGEKKRTRESSLESESSFKPDYECVPYSPSRPSIGATNFSLGKLQTEEDGVQALLISEDETLYYKVSLSKTLCTMERDIASLLRRLRPKIPAFEPTTWRTTTLTPSILGTLSKSLGVNRHGRPLEYFHLSQQQRRPRYLMGVSLGLKVSMLQQ